MSEEEEEEVLIVIMISSSENKEYKEKVISDVERNFQEAIEKGNIIVIEPPKQYYPNLKNVPRLYNDPMERVEWRSRQAIDYSFLFYFSIDFGKYFIQLEDDIEAVENFYEKMDELIEKHKNKEWSVIEFGSRGFIGMMYRNKHLLPLSKFTRFFYWVMPVDWLFRAFNDIVLFGNSREFKSLSPLFKHVGQHSSLNGQFRRLEDLENDEEEEKVTIKSRKSYFKSSKENPEAILRSSIIDYVQPNHLENPYTKKGVFWGKSLVDRDFIEIIFSTPQNVKRFVVSSGSSVHFQDRFDKTDLLVSSEHDTAKDKCLHYKLENTFNGNIIDQSFKPPKEHVRCFKILLQKVTKNNNGDANWLFIENIVVVV